MHHELKLYSKLILQIEVILQLRVGFNVGDRWARPLVEQLTNTCNGLISALR